jgi:hypothetical protein
MLAVSWSAATGRRFSRLAGWPNPVNAMVSGEAGLENCIQAQNVM